MTGRTTQFELITPEEVMMTKDAEMVVIPGSEGYLGIFPLHTPMIATLGMGRIELHNDGVVTDRLVIRGGFSEVTRTDVVVLANEAILVSDIDPAKAKSLLQDLREDYEDAQSEEEKETIAENIRWTETQIAGTTAA